MPNVVLEALALGTPVIASDIPACRQLVGDSAAVVWIDPLSAADVAAGIRSMMNGSHNAVVMLQEGHAIARRYSLEHALQAHREHYLRLAGGPFEQRSGRT
jgi:glycosyltransferase involved in cell wall biosynthesis